MSPKPLDLKLVEDRLEYLAQVLADLRKLPSESFADFEEDWRNAPSAESLVRRAVEAVLDVARHVLSAGFGMGGLEYKQVAKRASETGLIEDTALARTFVEIAGFRNRLTHHYEDVTSRELFGILSRHLGDLERIAGDLERAAGRLGERSGEDPAST